MSLVELTLELETPLLMGGHDPLKLDDVWFVRPSEIKGAWRWWARALVAGALYDAGELRGTSRRGILRAPSPNEAARISRIVGVEMGLGYADPRGGESKVSDYVIVVEPQVEVAKFRRPIREIREVAGLQRISLLTRARRGERRELECLAPGARFTLKVEERVRPRPLEPEAVESALSALSLALTLSGFGKASRRGLGCFRVVASKSDYAKDYAKLFDPRTPVAERLKRAIEAVRNLLKVEVVEGYARELPPLPSISAKKLAMDYKVGGRHLSLFQVLEVRLGAKRAGESALNQLLRSLHNFFLRSERARRLYGDHRAQDDLRRELCAWILGLPRKGGTETGYDIVVEGVDRRASPFFLAVHGGREAALAYLSAFVSADWLQELEWRGGFEGGQPVEVDEEEIVRAMAIALNEFVEYAERSNLRVSFSWP
jgi:CRISPR-associated protein Cmr1